MWGDTDSNWSTVPLQWSVSGMIVVPPAIPQTVRYLLLYDNNRLLLLLYAFIYRIILNNNNSNI